MFAPEELWENFLALSLQSSDSQSSAKLWQRASHIRELCEQARIIASHNPTQTELMDSWIATFLARAAWLYSKAGDQRQSVFSYEESLASVENAEVRANYVELLCEMNDLFWLVSNAARSTWFSSRANSLQRPDNFSHSSAITRLWPSVLLSKPSGPVWPPAVAMAALLFH